MSGPIYPINLKFCLIHKTMPSHISETMSLSIVIPTSPRAVGPAVGVAFSYKKAFHPVYVDCDSWTTLRGPVYPDHVSETIIQNNALDKDTALRALIIEVSDAASRLGFWRVTGTG